MTPRKLLSPLEAETRKLLGGAAEKNGAEVATKVRVADVLPTERLSGELHNYALKAHFDFVVVNAEYDFLFAVEFDDSSHQKFDAIERDRKKNAICVECSFPLARLHGQHIFQRARGHDYVTWLTELFFTTQAMVEAQESGALPVDEPVDPMLVISSPHMKGCFPHWLAAEARLKLQRLNAVNKLRDAYPWTYGGYRAEGRAKGGAFTMLGTQTTDVLVAMSEIYLTGFGISPYEAALEIATVSLADLADEYLRTGAGALRPGETRSALIRFLRSYPKMGSIASGGAHFAFPLRGDRDGWWFGEFEGEPEVRLPP